MFSFANPEALYLLIIIPILLVFFFLTRIARKKRLERFGNISILKGLMPEVSEYKPWIKTSIQLFAIFIIIIIIARPKAITEKEAENVKGIEVMIALDVSNSMLASSTDDPHGVSRLQKSKLLLEKLIDRLDNDKVGLIVFAGNAYTQIPITSDFISAKMFLNEIDTDMVPTQGTAIGEALQLALNSFTPNEKSQKAIVIITDGENFEDDAISMAKEAESKGIQVNVIGVGTSKGSLIPLGKNGQFLKDENGQTVVTKLDEKTAQEIAKAGNGVYVSANNSNAVSLVDNQLNTLAKSNLKKNTYNKHDEQFPIFAWIALIALLCDILVLDRKISWLNNINFFSKDEKKNK